jgi:hypothetical protein
MSTPHNAVPSVAIAIPYESPEIRLIGLAGEVVMGMPGGGFDGPYGMTDQPFEFEPDDLG